MVQGFSDLKPCQYQVVVTAEDVTSANRRHSFYRVLFFYFLPNTREMMDQTHIFMT